jgi:hypothetical protein
MTTDVVYITLGIYNHVGFMKRAFLYIDILGFKNLAIANSPKIKNIFKILDGLQSHNHRHYFSLQTVVFSDTILIFNTNDTEINDVHLYVTYLIEYTQELFYKLATINIYFKGVLTFGEFNFDQLKNIQAYYGLALIDTYKSEKELGGFGLFADKNISNKVIVFDKVHFSEKFDFVFLCQSLKNLYLITNGVLPTDINILTDTDDCYRIDEDLRFLREVEYLMSNHPVNKVKEKYRTVYDIYKNELPLFFEKFELEGFLPFTINSEYTGSINPFDLISERELSASEEELSSTSDEGEQVLETYDNELEEALNATLLKLSSP